jgi:hypothetical protein
MTTLEDILKSKGPMMSSELASIIETKLKIPKNSASQRVVRDKSILKVKGFFSSGQSFCYLEQHTKEIDFFDRLMKSMFDNGKKYWFCLNAIKASGGLISQNYLECYTNYPILPLKSHLPFRKVMQKFVENDILIFNDGYYFIAPKLNQSVFNFTQYQTIELIKEDIISNFSSLTKNIGLVSYNTGERFAEYGKFKWAFKGVCPVSGLKENNSFGYLLADILFGHPIYEKDVQFFLEKLKTIQSFKKSSRLLPFLIVDDIDTEALKLLKKNGIIVGFISELFGNKYAETLKELVTVLKNAGASLKKDPNKYLDLIIELKKYNQGLANNIKGALFEFVVGHIHSLENNCSIEIGREIFENGKHEIDVFATNNQKIIFAECKATKGQITIEQVDKWLGVKIPAFKKWASKQETWKNKELEFEYWSVNGFETDAEDKLKQTSNTASKIKISYFDGKTIRNKALKLKNKKLKEAIDNFFLKTEV